MHRYRDAEPYDQRYRRRVTDQMVKDCQETVRCKLTLEQIVTYTENFSRSFDIHEWSTPVFLYYANFTTLAR